MNFGLLLPHFGARASVEDCLEGARRAEAYGFDSLWEGIDPRSLIDEAHNASTWVRPPSGGFSTLEDIRGVLLAGTPADIARETRAYQDAGAQHVVYDLRLRYADWYEQIDLLGQEVLPALR